MPLQKRHLLFLQVSLLYFLIITFTTTSIAAQSNVLTFDWSTRPSTIGQSVSAPPVTIPTTEQFTIKITNVNDFFYDYHMDCTATAKSGPDLKPLIDLIVKPPQLEAPPPCEVNARNAISDLQEYLKKTSSCGSTCNSIPLAETRQKLSDFISSTDNLQCKLPDDVQAALNNFRATAAAFLAMSSHDVSFVTDISPDANYSCRITETARVTGIPTSNGTMTIAITPTNNVLTLSSGALFSAIQNRSYSAVSAPGSAGTSTVLGVQGNSFSSNIVALVNFRAPIRKLAGDKLGLDIGAGPSFRLNTNTTTTSVGFFAGISVRLYKYLFITPGVHVGSFADFPPGLARGTTLPANFPTPTPSTRTTAKFGIAMTFATKDFSSIGKTSATTTNPPQSAQQPPAQQAPAQQPPAQQPPAQQPPAQQSPVQQPPQMQGQSPKGLSLPALVDFGKLGTMPMTAQLTMLNNGSKPTDVLLDVQDSKIVPSEVHFAVAPGQGRAVTLTLNPGANIATAQIIVYADHAPIASPVKLTWTVSP